ncbi:chalcone isomerase family protein [Endozoicomonas arenosclerae]|uniref:chalcone isomerase family protein n=1 Tax=Endozoicomonas arenosclerae TaxID=1633495 RepID=UPI0007828BF4|nr:chalcone isomerase family protein [Endozoicomonas arenosclerae]
MKKVLLFISAIVMSLNLQAVELDGVKIPETLDMENQTLQLNGAGIRSKFFMDLYVGSLYTKNKTSDASSVINSKTSVAIQLDITSKLITSEKLTDAVNEGFDKATNGNIDPLKDRLTAFIDVFKAEIVKGDQFVMFVTPGKGVDVFKNGKKLTTIKGDDFSKALLSVWLGDKPADEKLKAKMLGN